MVLPMPAGLYESSINSLLERIIESLAVFLADDNSPPNVLLYDLSQLRNLLDEAGFKDVAALCKRMSWRLSSARPGSLMRRRAVARVVERACAFIGWHAEAVSIGCPPPPIPPELAAKCW
jgi:hypothetical protein